MAKSSFFSTEPLFLKCIYSIAFIGTLYVLYENIFVEEDKHSGIAIYLLVVFGFFFIRRATTMIRNRKAAMAQKHAA